MRLIVESMKTAHDLVTAAKSRIHEVTLTETEQNIRNADILIDVRESDEFSAGHIPGAIFVPRGILEFKLSSMPAMVSRDVKIILYCKTGGRAALAACAMQDMGYLNVQSIAGGFDAWTSDGKPVAIPEQPYFE